MKYKRLSKKFVHKLKHGSKYGINFSISLSGAFAVAFTFMSIAGIHLSITILILCISLILLASLCVVFIKGHIDHLPDKILFENEHDLIYEIAYETSDICSLFNQETAQYFISDYVEDLMVESWRLVNPKGFIYLRNQNQEPCAAMAILGLKKSFMEQFVKGKLSESDLDNSDILTLAESKRSSELYLAAVIVIEPHTIKGNRRALAIVWGLIHYLKLVYGTKKKRKIYAVPINKSSENLLQVISKIIT